mgnify:CR=1 FL=1
MKNLLRILILLPLFAQGQEHIIDPDFNDLEDRYKAEVNDLFYEPLDNTVLVVGWFPFGSPVSVPSIDKISVNGIPDEDWDPQGIVNLDNLRSIHRVSDGYRLRTNPLMAQLDFDGNFIEETLLQYPDWEPIGNIYTAHISEGDTIFVPGLFERVIDGESEYRQCLKFYPDGTLDESFIPCNCSLSTSSFAQYGLGFLKYDDERLIFTSSMDSINGHPTIKVARMFHNGRIDTSFVSQLSPEGGTGLLHVDDQGRILVTMAPRSTFFESDSLEVYRLMPDGSLDPSWNPIDLGYTPNLSIGSLRQNAVVPLEDGGYILGGHFRYVNGIRRTSIVKVDSTGVVDESLFDNEPFWVDSETYPYTWFLTDSVPTVNDIIPLEDGILVGGQFTHYGNTDRINLVKLILDETIGLNDSIKRLPLTVYPNPNSGVFTIQSNNSENITSIEVFDLAGRKVSFEDSRAQNKIEIAITANPGLYIVKIVSEDGRIGSAKVREE